jgi:hypothetical protein
MLVLCAVAVTICAAIAALRPHRLPTVSAAGTSNLQPESVSRREAGCPLGPTFTFCDRIPGTTSLNSNVQIGIVNAVKGVTASFAAIPGMASNFAAGDFQMTFNNCSGDLSAGFTCTVDVVFSPTTTGLRAAALTVADAGGDKLVFEFEGTGKNLALAPPPGFTGVDNAWSYPFTPVGGASAATTFTLLAGSAESGIVVSLAAIPGLESEFAPGDFTITGDSCTGALAAGGSCNIDVEFTPTAAGLRSAVLTATDASGDVSTIYVAGRTSGNLMFLQTLNGPECVAEQQAGYCAEPQGGTTAAIAYTLQNNSGTQITGLTITPPIPTNPPTLPPTDFTVQGTTCTATLAAGANCAINVAFTPQGMGERQGEIEATDAQGDVMGINLAGYGDDYQLQLASGQQQQLNVAQGDGVTYNAQVMPDSVFGANGEQVTLVCPTNLPTFSTCAFSGCPLAITPGTATSFSIMIVTSSKTKQAPPATSPCSETNGAATPPSSGPRVTIRLAPEPAARRWLFPALSLLAAVMAMAFAELSRRGSRVRLIFAGAGIAAMIFAGCGGGGNSNIGVTPIATTNMTINGNALDASGNALNAGRPLSITLDVVKGP